MLQKKHKRQQRYRRGGTLLKKAYELSIMADADVFLGIKFRDTGRIKTFCADTTVIWSSHLSHLDSYYPIPEHKTPNDFSGCTLEKKMEEKAA
ncbi:hypothetical protein EYB26_005076 [Talaromyces marneffei]|nr:uncharacterized protein EYB26_005076 [Talaromyces marneffei]QGA17405.1 hypothetical protein EYB26_005076 [Talaromyces marneffei]